MPAEFVVSTVATDAARGLTRIEATRRIARDGRNKLVAQPPESVWRVLLRQFRGLLTGVLAVAAAVSLAFGDVLDAVAIVVVLLLNASLGFFTELRAIRSMEGLRALGAVRARVRRDGGIVTVDAEEIVVGDIVVLEAGDLVNADLRVLRAAALQVDESTLTGESVPVEKTAAPVAEDAILAERSSMLFRGTAVTRGDGEGVVVATGMHTELGRIAELVAATTEERTPLERRLEQLARRLVHLVVVLGTLVIVVGALQGRPLLAMIEMSLALAVAAVPEGLPIVATIALARGVHRMARRHALVEKLSAVETLGATSTIFTDKTGTLTENRLAARTLVLADGEVEVGGEAVAAQSPSGELLRAGALCNRAAIDNGDPLEVALLVAAAGAGIDVHALRREWREIGAEAFDAVARRMATVHQRGERVLVTAKGATEHLLDSCSRVRTQYGDEPLPTAGHHAWLAREAELAQRGLRVIALAQRQLGQAPAELFADLTLLGLAGLADPPRAGVRAVLQDCRRAGIRVIMVTGDHAATAASVARSLELVRPGDRQPMTGRELAAVDFADPAQRQTVLDTSIFARVDPEQKLRLVELHQRQGHVVAMTGDGVNDAPALRKADIGVAMGKRGTQVAQQAADIVLTDDSFATIVAAVREGRTVFANIRAFTFYLLSCNVSEVMVVVAALAADLPMPLLPLQILFLNLITDVFPALALGFGAGTDNTMRRPPRPPGEPVLTRRHWWAIAAHGVVITTSVLTATALVPRVMPGAEPRELLTVSFTTLALAQLWHVFNVREAGTGVMRNSVSHNPWVWAALAVCVALIAMAMHVPLLGGVLHLQPLDARGWLLVLAASAVPLAVGQSWLIVVGRRDTAPSGA